LANAKFTKDIINVCIDSDVVPFLWGWHGGGKSSIVKQVCKDKFGKCVEGKDGNFIDLRLGNLEVGDLIGLPIEKQLEEVGKTIFALPEFWPSDGEGILFLDELNRAQQVVLQACFSLVLDRKIHSYKLPDGWKIVSAGNPTNEDYIVNEIDSALFSRFCHILYEPTKKDWIKYASESKEFLPDIVSFIDEKGENLLFGDLKNKNLKENIVVEPNPRSYEMLSKTMKHFDYENELDLLRYISFGLIGESAGTAFVSHVRESDKPLTGKEIVDDYKKSEIKKKIKKWTSSSQINLSIISASATNLVDEIIERITNEINYFKQFDETFTTKSSANRKHKNDYSVLRQNVEDKSKKGRRKNIETFVYNEKLSNIARFLVDVPSELAIAVIRRDLHMKESSSESKRSGPVKENIVSILRYLINHVELSKVTREMSKVVSKGKLKENEQQE